jgi:alpha-tubulin suppressor-like RCC1 family protein
MRNGHLLSRALVVAILASAACGDGDNNVDVVVSEIDFGGTDCGTTAIPRVLTITNNSPNSFSFNTGLALGEESPYEVIPANGAVLARSQLTVMIYSKPIPQESEITDNLYGDMLTVTTDKDGDKPHLVAIKQTARGAIFEASSDTVNIAAPVPMGTSVTAPIMITNVGNASAKLKATSSFFNFTIDSGGQVIAPGDSVAATLQFTPAHNVADNQTMTLAAESGPICGAPSTVAVSGTGTAKGLAVQAVPAATTPRPNNSGGASTLCVKTTTGTVVCGGGNFYGMRGASDDFLMNIGTANGKGGGSGVGGGLGILDIVNTVQLKGGGFLSNVTDLVSGTGFYCARTTNKDEYCWGDYNGLGNNQNQNPARLNPGAVRVATDTRDISAGYLYRCVVKEPDGALSCRSSRAGTDFDLSPIGWSRPAGVLKAVTSGSSTYALLSDGTIETYGLNSNGERGSDVGDNAPGSLVTDFASTAEVVAGGRAPRRGHRFGCARKTDNSVYCWGNNRHGQLGNGTTSNGTNGIFQVIDSTDAPIVATQISAGKAHVCANIAGGVSCWGFGRDGAIGSDSSGDVSRAQPTDPALTGVTNLEAAGTRATCAVITGGAVRCWGYFADAGYFGPEPIYAFEP